MTTIYNAPYIPFAIVDQQGRPTGQFQQYWQTTFDKAVTNAVAAAQAAAAAAAAQTTADGKQPLSGILTGLSSLVATAGLLEQTAPDTYAIRLLGVTNASDVPTRGNADSRYVKQQDTPSWTASTGTPSRGALASFTGTSVGPFTVSNPPTQAEVQAVADALVSAVSTLSAALVAQSQALVALITDLIADKALKNP